MTISNSKGTETHGTETHGTETQSTWVKPELTRVDERNVDGKPNYVIETSTPFSGPFAPS